MTVSGTVGRLNFVLTPRLEKYEIVEKTKPAEAGFEHKVFS